MAKRAQLYYQLGHQFKWSLESIRNDGDGLIIAPRHMAPEKVQAIQTGLRRRSFFDPQFFLPNSARGKLAEYSFFPDILSGGFTTGEWNLEVARTCADRCLNFQRTLGFQALVIPGRFYEGMPSDFISDQEEQFVVPFLDSLRAAGGDDTPVFLQLILTDQMLKDDSYRTSILNWITSFQELDGVYLIYYVQKRQKQISDIDLLAALLQFIGDIKQSGLSIVVGYTNTESILLLCAGADVLTMGSYENLRIFSLRAFEEPQDRSMRGPTARVYVPRLLQWIEHQYIGAIQEVVGDIDEYLDDNEYRVRMFEPTYNWHFTKPEPYRHYFSSFGRQFQRLSTLRTSAIVDAVLDECRQAIQEFSNLSDEGVVFPPDSGGGHLACWVTAINLWRRRTRM